MQVFPRRVWFFSAPACSSCDVAMSDACTSACEEQTTCLSLRESRKWEVEPGLLLVCLMTSIVDDVDEYIIISSRVYVTSHWSYCIWCHHIAKSDKSTINNRDQTTLTGFSVSWAMRHGRCGRLLEKLTWSWRFIAYPSSLSILSQNELSL
jgi:hypothetical protein